MDQFLSFCLPLCHITLASSLSLYLCLLSFPFGSLSLNLSVHIKKDITGLKGKKKENGTHSCKGVNEKVEAQLCRGKRLVETQKVRYAEREEKKRKGT